MTFKPANMKAPYVRGYGLYELSKLISDKHDIYSNAKTVVNPNIQEPADNKDIFELRKYGCMYYMVNGPRQLQAHGGYIFVILASCPHTIYCGAQEDDPEMDIRAVRGHTSISNREDALYAGELLFDQGKMITWTNGSGHYLPTSQSRYRSLTPYVRLLLREELFFTVYDEQRGEYFVYNPLVLAARGYGNGGTL